MQELDDIALLEEYVARGSEQAFATLVRRHLNKVYSVALRHTGGNPSQAEEIAQAVFVLLSSKAAKLGRKVILSGWLYQTARLTSVTFLRGEIRRARRQQEAHMQTLLDKPDDALWIEMAPLIDTAMSGLNETDRHAVVLRYFDGRSLKEVGAALGANEDAAKKRVSRALEKLRALLARQGVTSTTAAIAGAITVHSVQAAPVELAQSVTTTALAQSAAAGGSTLALAQGVSKIMAWTQVKTVATALVIAAGVFLPITVQQNAQARLRAADASLAEQDTRLKTLRDEQDQLNRELAALSSSQKQAEDLARLRAEATTLAAREKAVEQLRHEHEQPRAQAKQSTAKTALQLKEEAVAKLNFGRNWIVAFHLYASEHNGQFPKNYADAAIYLPDEAKKQTDLTFDMFDVVYQGSPNDLKDPPSTIVLMEKESWNAGESSNPTGKWSKVYVFADGHSEVHMSPDNDFTAYEQQHIIPPPGNP